MHAKQADEAVAVERQQQVSAEHMHSVMGELASKADLSTVKQLEELVRGMSSCIDRHGAQERGQRVQADKLHDAMDELASKADRKVAREAEMSEQARRVTAETHHTVMGQLESAVDLKVVKKLEEQVAILTRTQCRRIMHARNGPSACRRITRRMRWLSCTAKPTAARPAHSSSRSRRAACRRTTRTPLPRSLRTPSRPLTTSLRCALLVGG